MRIRRPCQLNATTELKCHVHTVACFKTASPNNVLFYSKTFFYYYYYRGSVMEVVTFPSLVGRRRVQMISLIRTSGPGNLPSTRYPYGYFYATVKCHFLPDTLFIGPSVKTVTCFYSWKPSRILPPNSLGVSLDRCHERTLRLGLSGDRIPVGGDAFHTRPDQPWAPPSLLDIGVPGHSLRWKRPGRGLNHPPS